ncbi:hypothetical protein ACFVU2_08600 [Leifsonia sp. NPDC058194]|uniref:hypothetical protein n=1 Tax=Leifsonia sp. NPDC058194 TaxID=3346374 RepID=UPI0036D97B83
MTSWPEQPADGQPPLTRRQARESERTAARQETRRAGTAEPTPGGEIPTFTTPASAAGRADRPDDAASAAPERPSIPATAFAEPGVLPPSRPSASGGDDFDALVFTAPGGPAADETEAAPSSLFREASDPSTPEAVTQPVSIVASGDAAAGIVPERTLTRREMRAMMQAQEANQQANHTPHLAEPVVPIAFDAPPAATPEQPAGAQEPSFGAQPEAAVADDTKKAWPFAPLTPSSSGEEAEKKPAFAPNPAFEAPAFAPAPAAAQPAPTDDVSAEERRPFTPPTGHWSTAADVEDVSEPIISRNVGQSTAATTTNALILPSIPRPDATAPLTSTGEILVTGSIDLPRGVGSTGLNPEHLDSSDIDNLLDGEENEFNTSEVAPVRASRAISTHTSTRGVITPPKKRGNALPTVLIITAGVLAVGVIGLLVAAYWLKVF